MLLIIAGTKSDDAGTEPLAITVYKKAQAVVVVATGSSIWSNISFR